MDSSFFFFFFLIFYFYFILLYNTVLVLPYIDMVDSSNHTHSHFKINKKKKIGYFTVTLILKLFFYNLMTRLALPGIKLPAPPGDQHGNITRTQNFEHEISSGSSG